MHTTRRDGLFGRRDAPAGQRAALRPAPACGPRGFPFPPALVLLGVTVLWPALAAGQGTPAPAPVDPAAALLSTMASEGATSPSALKALIARLGARSVLSKEDSAQLSLLAEADAAEARAQTALAQAALAQAAAAEARARAYAALAQAALAGNGAPAPSPTAAVTAPPVPPVAPLAALAPAESVSAPVASAASAPPSPAVVEASAPTLAAAPVAAPAPNPPAEPAVPDDTVRVTYVPEVVKQELRQEVKQDVLDEARKEGWATPHAVPGWVSRFRLFGDFRSRYEGFRYPAGNDDTGAFPNFNAINTGAPFDTTGTVFSPQYNVDQNRNRLRLRVRVGSEIDLGDSFSVGLRVATGENNSPVTENQSLGLAGSGQGGNFAKYAIWLDRAFLRYEVGGLPDKDLTIDVGRFDNPFFATSMTWADDLGFDGVAARAKFPLGESVTPFFTAGAFPVFNTDLNFASNQPAKFKSDDKWLYAGQLGVTLDLGNAFALKLGSAYYVFQNVEGRLSSPFTPLTTLDAGDTDDSRPAFAQKGNTYMALRDIVPSALNNNGTIDQFQYYGLASKFHELAFDARIDFNQFEPFQISLSGEYVRNRAFDPTVIAAIAVNNRGAAASGSSAATGPFLGGNTAWLTRLTLGYPALKSRWDWNAGLDYRKVESDAVVDGFCDSDFGGGGTNLKGVTFFANLALSPDVWLGVRWMSASQLAGPIFRNDLMQMDLNTRF